MYESAFMPPAPGWLGDLIDAQVQNQEKSQIIARKRLIKKGVSIEDISFLLDCHDFQPDREDFVVGQLAKKWRKLLMREKL